MTEEKKKSFESESSAVNYRNLVLCAVAANLSSICIGTVFSWSSPAMSKLESGDPPFNASMDQASWMAGLMGIGAALGPWVAGFCADQFGRQRSLLLISIPFLISWIILAATKIIGLIYFARILAGFAVGCTFTVLPMYIGEISTKEIRGVLSSFLQTFIALGVIYMYSIGPYISWLWLQLIGLILPAVFAFIFFWMPESPYYYIAKKDKDSATKSLMWLRKKSNAEVEEECTKIEQAVKESYNNTTSFKELWSTKGNIRGLIITVGLAAFQQLSGVNPVTMYTANIFSLADGGMKPEVSTIITGVAQFAGSLITPLAIDKFGRRFLLLLSCVGMCVAHVMLGVYFHIQQQDGQDVSNISFLPILSLLLYICSYAFGIGPLPWVLMGEVFPPNIKSKASTVTASFCWLLAFLITKFFPSLLMHMGYDAAFWMFAGFCAAAGVFVFFLVPETKGKSLVEIQNILNK